MTYKNGMLADALAIATHIQFYKSGKTKSEAFNNLNSMDEFNIMDVGISTFTIIDLIWEGNQGVIDAFSKDLNKFGVVNLLKTNKIYIF